MKMPSVLLLDEPLSNLDARLRLQTREELRRIQQETKITTIFVTHDQEEAMSISDMIIVMSAGVVQQIGPPQQVYDDPVNLFVAKFLGTPPINVFEGEVKDGNEQEGRFLTDPDALSDHHYVLPEDAGEYANPGSVSLVTDEKLKEAQAEIQSLRENRERTVRETPQQTLDIAQTPYRGPRL